MNVGCIIHYEEAPSQTSNGQAATIKLRSHVFSISIRGPKCIIGARRGVAED